MAGINRALLSEDRRIIFENCVASREEKGKCVFISHKSSDIDAAQQVAEYLMSNGIDVYLDKLDAGLQKATRENADGQAHALVQISEGIDQIAKVMQNTAASAEEGTAISGQLSEEAAEMNELIHRFQLFANKKR